MWCGMWCYKSDKSCGIYHWNLYQKGNFCVQNLMASYQFHIVMLEVCNMSIFRHTYYAINLIFYFHLSNNSCSHSNFMNKQHHNFYLCCNFMNKQHHRFYLCHNFMSKQHCSSYFYHSFMSKFLLVYKFHHNLSTKCLKIDCLLYFLQI